MSLLERMQSEPAEWNRITGLSQRIGTNSLTYEQITTDYLVYDYRGTQFNERVTIPFAVKRKGKLTGRFYSEAEYASSPCNVCRMANRSRPKGKQRIECIVAESFDCCATCLCADIPCVECNWKRLPESTWNSIASLAQSPPRYASNTTSKRALEEEEMQIKGVGYSSSSVQILGSSDARKRQKSEQMEQSAITSINFLEDTVVPSRVESVCMEEQTVSSHNGEQSDLISMPEQIMSEICVQTEIQPEEDLAEIKAESFEEMREDEEYIQEGELQDDVIQNDVIQDDVIQDDVVQDDVVQDDVVQNDVVQDDVVRDDVVQNDVVQDVVAQNDEIPDDAIQDVANHGEATQEEVSPSKQESEKTAELINKVNELTEMLNTERILFGKVMASQNQELTKKFKSAEETIKLLQRSLKGHEEENIRERRKYKERLTQEKEENDKIKQQKKGLELIITQQNEAKSQQELTYTESILKLRAQIAKQESDFTYKNNNAKAKIQEYEKALRQKDWEIKGLKLSSEAERKRLQNERDSFEQAHQRSAEEMEEVRKLVFLLHKK
ncbi:uncharacterized protein FA14DRAFT_158449 [Meira miltonrushii]|uniref:Uncharacterized protein n=1 Tax=Meira miltonrushii TaxID=1280837 RepID=A0A316V849_9BASI|nr:uncharacterized protein FA14DRAFT_158449 [Meira miltonrushii]PWN31635.1 hypothetical protein FA14DRAFT_158449 [Meira miltonrushii]